MAVKPRGTGDRLRYCIAYYDPELFPNKKLVYLKWVFSLRDWDNGPDYFDRQPTIQVGSRVTAARMNDVLKWVRDGKGVDGEKVYSGDPPGMNWDEAAAIASAIQVMVAPPRARNGARDRRFRKWWDTVTISRSYPGIGG